MLNLVCSLGHKTAHKNAKYFMVLIFYDVEIFGVASFVLSVSQLPRHADETGDVDDDDGSRCKILRQQIAP